LDSRIGFSYYPGCALEGMNKAYDTSTRLVSKELGIDLTELNDWNCCGASAYVSIQELRAHLLSARNLSLAEKENKDLVVVCPACFTTLTKSNRYMGEDLRLRKTITSALKAANLQYSGTVKVRHLLEVIVRDIGEQEVKAKVSKPLSGLKIAPYYGCQFTRPFGDFDDKEFPIMLDSVLKWIGAEPVDFPLKAKCCGGMQMTTNEQVGLTLVRSLLDSATQNGAECIATICPLCHMTLEAYQGNVNKKFATDFKLPTLYFTQFMGLAFGFSRKELGINQELISSKAVITKHVEVV
jgi:heterodisulfide reductase subunit B